MKEISLRYIYIILKIQLLYNPLSAEAVASCLRFPERSSATFRDQWVTDTLIINCPLCNYNEKLLKPMKTCAGERTRLSDEKKKKKKSVDSALTALQLLDIPQNRVRASGGGMVKPSVKGQLREGQE